MRELQGFDGGNDGGAFTKINSESCFSEEQYEDHINMSKHAWEENSLT